MDVMGTFLNRLGSCLILKSAQDWRLERKWSAVGFCSGAIAGLVAITPGSGFVGARELLFAIAKTEPTHPHYAVPSGCRCLRCSGGNILQFRYATQIYLRLR
jgi:hypothetical protein